MSYNEEALEQSFTELLKDQGFARVQGITVHKEMSDVLLRDDLKQFLLNQYGKDDITLNEIDGIIRKLDLYPSSSLYDSNKAIMKLIADGFVLKREDRSMKDLFIQLIDFRAIVNLQTEVEKSEYLMAASTMAPYQVRDNNIYKIVTQLEIQGYEKRIPDAIVYINGLPLVVIEFKSAVKINTTIKDAYTQLTVRYRRDIPELFKYNAFCVISDGVNNKSGSFFAPYDCFNAWRKVHDEDDAAEGIDSLFTMIRGLFQKERLLDVIRNFIWFPDKSNDELKIVCRYPQYYAANKLMASIKKNMRPMGSGKGGTYFGATGCGKSFTMLFLTRLLMRSTHFASPTIVLITDRTDLDDQLSAQFTNAKDFIGDDQVISVESRDELRRRLQDRKSGGVFLTTIQKFSESTSLLTDRNNVICISDEAHRSQVNLDQRLTVTSTSVTKKYGFAKYLHDSLPNATYVGFTGTPVDATMDVFGGIADAYTMQDSVADGITVKIAYEGRAAKVLLNEERLKEIEDYYKQCAEIGTNDYQIEESKKAVTQMEVILGDQGRLKLLASDFVQHYETRVAEGALVKGKVMLVSSSRKIAYDLYKAIVALRPEWAEVRECDEGVELTSEERKEIKPIEKIKMVMTRSQDDHKTFYDMLGSKDYKKELDRQFKNVKSNFKIAIVVDMWVTGFDVPALDAIYIDKPLQLHSLIQTISRVNRVFDNKERGLVVDYIGIKSNMNLALKKYSKISSGDFEDTYKAVVIVKDQLDLLDRVFHRFDRKPFFMGSPLEKLHCLNRAVEFVQLTEELEKRFMAIVRRLRSAYDLCCSSEEISEEERDQIHFYFAIRSIVHKLTPGEAPDTAQMNDKVREMIHEALISDGVEEIFKLDKDNPLNNADIFSDEYMAKIEKITLPNTKIKLLQKLLSKAVEEFKKTNRIRGVDFSKKLRRLVEVYNERKDFDVFKSDVLEDVAEQFSNLFKELQKERNSFMDLGIDFEEKAFYDILKAIAEKYEFEYPNEKLIKLSKEVKAIVDDKAKYTDWSQRNDIKAELKVALILVLDENGYPPKVNDEVFKEIFEQAENFKKYAV